METMQPSGLGDKHVAADRDSLLLGLERLLHWQTHSYGHLPGPIYKINSESLILTLQPGLCMPHTDHMSIKVY